MQSLGNRESPVSKERFWRNWRGVAFVFTANARMLTIRAYAPNRTSEDYDDFETALKAYLRAEWRGAFDGENITLKSSRK